ncbi:hypothetical protein ECC02_010613 [Trypanosoma cruzi]|uniref:Uncharacterized protein n=1 Tax=Trypanosoma cruzi TaxID=5693 RepID=A0A7J6XQ92_TRYCR|nr:hypothetical protein ECC02_010613 [Trypanosoma cruzi]
MHLPPIKPKQQHHPTLQVAVVKPGVRRMRILPMLNGPTPTNHTKILRVVIPAQFPQPVRQHLKQQEQLPPPTQLIRRRLATLTAAPRSPTPPPLFCFFFFLRVRLLLWWWPRESEGERAVLRPHTHSSFTHSLCMSPCMDSRPHLTPRGTHIMCPLYICMHTHAGPLVLSFAPHAPLPSCLAAWAEHRNCFCFVFIALSGRPLFLSPCVCVLLYGSNERMCAGRPTLRLLFFCLFYLFYLCCG